MELPAQPNLRVTIIAADGLYKRDVFRFPDPFAVATISGEQTKTTGVIKKTLNPYWNESFDMRVNEESILAVVWGSGLAGKHLRVKMVKYFERGAGRWWRFEEISGTISRRCSVRMTFGKTIW